MTGAAQLVATHPGQVIVAQSVSSFLPSNREALTLQFLSSDATHLLFIDADVGWTASDAERLLAANKEFVTAIYAKKQPSQAPDAVFLGAWEGDLVEVEHTGFGFALLARSGVERIVASHPELRYDTPVGAGFAFWSPQFDGKYYSEDVTFCARWRALGGKVWAHSRVVLKRYGDTTYLPRGIPANPGTGR
jgi:hypothetical protein